MLETKVTASSERRLWYLRFDGRQSPAEAAARYDVVLVVIGRTER